MFYNFPQGLGIVFPSWYVFVIWRWQDVPAALETQLSQSQVLNMIQAWHSTESVPNNNTDTASLNTIVYCQLQCSVLTLIVSCSRHYEHHFWSFVNSLWPGCLINLMRAFILSVSLAVFWLPIQTSQVLVWEKDKTSIPLSFLFETEEAVI